MDAICATAGMPPRRVVRRWLVQQPEFAAHYHVARTLQAESCADQLIEIESKLLSGEMKPAVAAAAISSIQWRMQRLSPASWGNKVEVARPAGELRTLTDADLERIVATGSGANSPEQTPRTGRLN